MNEHVKVTRSNMLALLDTSYSQHWTPLPIVLLWHLWDKMSEEFSTCMFTVFLFASLCRMFLSLQLTFIFFPLKKGGSGHFFFTLLFMSQSILEKLKRWKISNAIYCAIQWRKNKQRQISYRLLLILPWLPTFL